MTVADLSPEALVRLEAKLVADLEMVRKVRALLEEHREALAAVAAPPTVVEPAAPAPAAVPQVSVSRSRPIDELLMECLVAMPRRPFSPQDFMQAMKKHTGQYPPDRRLKTFLARMIRQGKVVVHEFRRGRAGSLYACLIPPVAAPADPPAASDNHTETPPRPSGTA